LKQGESKKERVGHSLSLKLGKRSCRQKGFNGGGKRGGEKGYWGLKPKGCFEKKATRGEGQRAIGEKAIKEKKGLVSSKKSWGRNFRRSKTIPTGRGKMEG